MIRLFLLFCLIGLLSYSCSDDDEVCCDTGGKDVVLNYDGDNFSAPTLLPGNYNFAIKLPTTLINRLAGQNLKQVNVYMYDAPSSARLTVYSDNGGSPGAELHVQDMTAQIVSNSWITVDLTQPVPIDGSTIWVGVDVSIPTVMQTVGCDQGPADPNGDWLYDGADGEYIRFLDRIGESVNWNIRVVVGE